MAMKKVKMINNTKTASNIVIANVPEEGTEELKNLRIDEKVYYIPQTTNSGIVILDEQPPLTKEEYDKHLFYLINDNLYVMVEKETDNLEIQDVYNIGVNGYITYYDNKIYLMKSADDYRKKIILYEYDLKTNNINNYEYIDSDDYIASVYITNINDIIYMVLDNKIVSFNSNNKEFNVFPSSDIVYDNWGNRPSGAKTYNNGGCKFCCVGSKIWRFGGQYYDYVTYTTHETVNYDIENKKQKSIDEPYLASSVCNIDNNFIYLFGNTSNLQSMSKFNINTESFLSISATLPQNKSNVSFLLDNTIYVYQEGTLYKFDTLTETFMSLYSITLPISNYNFCVKDKDLYMVKDGVIKKVSFGNTYKLKKVTLEE